MPLQRLPFKLMPDFGNGTTVLQDAYADARFSSWFRIRAGTYKEEFIKPGEIVPVTIRLTNSAITFRTGHKVRVLISSSNYPKYVPNRNDGGAMYGKEGSGVVANNSVYFDATRPSALLLPVAGR